jgi:hypothetical protein
MAWSPTANNTPTTSVSIVPWSDSTMEATKASLYFTPVYLDNVDVSKLQWNTKVGLDYQSYWCYEIWKTTFCGKRLLFYIIGFSLSLPLGCCCAVMLLSVKLGRSKKEREKLINSDSD